MALTVRPALAADMPAVYAVRHEVFVVGQDVPEDLERDELDETAQHVVAVDGDTVVGTGRLVDGGDGVGVLGRLAVTAQRRGHGAGVALVRAIEEAARRAGLRTVELHAQTHALPFYERLGYRAYGPVFDEAGIPHRSMTKDL